MHRKIWGFLLIHRQGLEILKPRFKEGKKGHLPGVQPSTQEAHSSAGSSAPDSRAQGAAGVPATPQVFGDAGRCRHHLMSSVQLL